MSENHDPTVAEGPTPEAAEVTAGASAEGCPVAHGRVHRRPGVGGLGAARLRLERQPQADARWQPLRGDQHVRALAVGDRAHAAAASKPTGRRTTIRECAFSLRTITG